ncbi:hypothetical protein D3C76_1831160 [compost metagenome]
MQAVTHHDNVTQHQRELVAALDLDRLHQIATGDGPHAGTGLGKSALESTQRGKCRETARQPAHHRQCQVSQ